jgi:hypothetical protein
MRDDIEEAGDLPSLLEIRAFVLQCLQHVEAPGSPDLPTITSNACYALLFLAAGERATLAYMTDLGSPATFLVKGTFEREGHGRGEQHDPDVTGHTKP